jgi:hypothetical protein
MYALGIPVGWSESYPKSRFADEITVVLYHELYPIDLILDTH